MPQKKNNPHSTQVRGRGLTLSPRMLSALVVTISNGVFLKTACQHVGISEGSFYRWMNRGEALTIILNNDFGDGAADEIMLEHIDKQVPDQKDLFKQETIANLVKHPPADIAGHEHEWVYWVFFWLVEKAKTIAEVRAVGIIQNAMPDNWQAAGWYLERSHPDKYGRRERVNLSGSEDGQPIQVQNVSVESLEEKIRKLAGGQRD